MAPVSQWVRGVSAADTETQLEHSQGIGRWVVRWTVTRRGGDLGAEENDRTATVVTVRLDDTVT